MQCLCFHDGRLFFHLLGFFLFEQWKSDFFQTHKLTDDEIDYDSEVIEILLKVMENERDDLVAF